ncbi:MAG TPA: pyruvate formate-lyase-activating protein [Candidatus Udaeobacter sp.]|jgi:pyruvate formate lyase activating enzyme|nr:pyruvate formate-lyase-activating protein [Candidatus Udaeobacter sp.]
MKLEAMEPVAPPIGSPFDLRLSASEKIDETDIQLALKSGDWGFIHSFTTGSAVDGPGMRIVGWLSACQFRCVFCHNPDTWKLTNGTPVRLERAVEVVKQYRTSLRTMKGGLTISGGEPLTQYRFLSRLFPAIHQLGIHTALETNGYFGERLNDEDLSSIDLVMLGLKAIEPDLHKRLTGMDNKPVHEFARRLAARKHPVWIRFVIVPSWTDNMEEIDRMAGFAAGLGNVQRVDVLPFHQMGRFKWEKLKMDYKMRDAQPPPREIMDMAISRFRAAGLKTV